jgi:DNA modification methylase
MINDIIKNISINPYYKTEKGVLYCNDCFDIINKIPDKSIDLVLTDPPYNIRWKTPIELHGRKPFMHNYKELQLWDNTDLSDLYKRLFPELNRIVKNSGSLLIFGPQEWAYYMLEPARKNEFDFKTQIIWIKTNPVPQVRKKNYLSTFENIIWFARWDNDFCLFTFNFTTQEEMKNIFVYPICSGKERTAHPTQKPLELIKKLVYIHSNENDIVLDLFLGSGTTAIACEQLNRYWIGVEKNEKYCQISQTRIEKERMQLKLSESNGC